MTNEPSPSRPGRGEQRLSRWLKLVTRTIGCGGVVYSALFEHNGLNMIVFGAMATGLDMGQFVIALVRAALQEVREVQRLSHDGADDSPRPES